MKRIDTDPERRMPEPDPSLTELLRQAMAGLAMPGSGLTSLLDRMERAA